MTKDIRDWLEVELGQELFLFGSRSKITDYDEWFEPLTQKYDLSKSDWDYATQTHPNVISKLHKLGFDQKDDLAYFDTNTHLVFEKIIDGEKIQVSLRNDLQTFKSVWCQIPSGFYFKHIWKQSPSAWPREDVAQFLDTLFYTYELGRFRGVEEGKKKAMDEFIWE